MSRRKSKSPDGVSAEQQRMIDLLVADAEHGNRGFLDGLSERERSLAVSLLAQYVADTEAGRKLLDAVWEIDYRQRPVDIETFITSPEYMGEATKTLSPAWMGVLKEVRAPNSRIFEIIFGGSLGTGKSFVGMLLQCYDVYRLSCLKNPQGFYGLGPKSVIGFGLYSLTMTQAKNACFVYLRNFIDQCPYFRERYPRDLRIESEIRFRDDPTVRVVSGSQSAHVIGLNVFSFAVDEANFLKSKMDPETQRMVGQAYDLYDATRDRLASRFLRNGRIPGTALLMSSDTNTSFTKTRLRELTGLANVEDVRGPITRPGGEYPTAYYAGFSLWDVYPQRYRDFPSKYFVVEVGDASNQTIVLPPNTESVRRDVRTVKVPMFHYEDFRVDPDRRLRNLAGVSTDAINPFIRDVRSILDAVSQTRQNPFAKGEYPICDGTTIDLCEEFMLETACVVEHGNWVPRLYPNAPRYLHLDLSTSGDVTGLGMGFHDGYRSVRRKRMDGTVVSSSLPIIQMDLLIGCYAEPNTYIDFPKILSFITFLSQFYPIAVVTTDGFEGHMMRQMIRNAGIEADVQSVDRTTDPYAAMRVALHDRRLILPHTGYDARLQRYDHGTFHREASHLYLDPDEKKVDHPQKNPDGTKGSKDQADAVAAIVYRITEALGDSKRITAADTTQPTTRQEALAHNAKGKWEHLLRNVGR